MTTVAWAFTLLLAAADPARPPLPYFGLDFRWMPGTAQQKFLHVERVVPDGPAARAGLRPGDQITHIGGVPVDFGDELDFLIFIRGRKPNERLVLKLSRAGKPLQVVVTLGTLPEAGARRGNRASASRNSGASRPGAGSESLRNDVSVPLCVLCGSVVNAHMPRARRDRIHHRATENAEGDGGAAPPAILPP